MLIVCAIIAVAILTLCVWLIFRPEAAETAAYTAYLDHKQRKLDLRELRRKRPISDGAYWIIIPICAFATPLVLWALFH